MLETWWDAINVGVGIASFIGNVRQGNAGAAVVDAVGVVADSIGANLRFKTRDSGVVTSTRTECSFWGWDDSSHSVYRGDVRVAGLQDSPQQQVGP